MEYTWNIITIYDKVLRIVVIKLPTLSTISDCRSN